jgi:predicted permease
MEPIITFTTIMTPVRYCQFYLLYTALHNMKIDSEGLRRLYLLEKLNTTSSIQFSMENTMRNSILSMDHEMKWNFKTCWCQFFLAVVTSFYYQEFW